MLPWGYIAIHNESYYKPRKNQIRPKFSHPKLSPFFSYKIYNIQIFRIQLVVGSKKGLSYNLNIWATRTDKH